MSPADYQAPLLAQLAEVAAKMNAHSAAIIELDHERRRLEYVLRNSGWRPDDAVQGELLP